MGCIEIVTGIPCHILGTVINRNMGCIEICGAIVERGEYADKP